MTARRTPRLAALVAVLLALPLLALAPAAPAGASASAARGTVRYVGHGTARSCTSRAVVRAVAKGGVIRFRCGPRPVTIEMSATAKVVNTSRRVVIDGGGKVTLDGLGKHRILYLNTCDPRQRWTTTHCDDQQYPQLVVRDITLKRGYDGGDRYDGGGGGAIFDRGGRLRIVNTRFVRNRCRASGPDVGGAAVRALEQWHDRPVHVTGSVFRGGRCSNGAGISSIGVSWQVRDSVFRNNAAIGHGANPTRPGTAGGGSGGAIYLDGNRFSLDLTGTTISHNVANEGGGAVFFVSNDRTGTMTVRSSVLTANPSRGFENYPGIFFLGHGRPTFIDSTVR
ncbi:hypothetical protein SAMN04487968_104314 [Nocardioides terrae]|uniref:Right handed beta helix region n=1 Tax=Nocardioides terrae TaxID=574651 RepID=A0A1I1HGN9_9ACTN|nr:hypothetical protein [Nocardioides terrae]SFC22986.1 hypothetical protein SAMN04487968_104314 [Nocardioides terrae]